MKVKVFPKIRLFDDSRIVLKEQQPSKKCISAFEEVYKRKPQITGDEKKDKKVEEEWRKKVADLESAYGFKRMEVGTIKDGKLVETIIEYHKQYQRERWNEVDFEWFCNANHLGLDLIRDGLEKKDGYLEGEVDNSFFGLIMDHQIWNGEKWISGNKD